MSTNETEAKAMTKPAVVQHLAESAKLSKKQVGQFFDALIALIKQELGKKGPGVKSPD